MPGDDGDKKTVTAMKMNNNEQNKNYKKINKAALFASLNHILTFTLVAAIFSISHSLGHTPQSPTAREILEKTLAALGGKHSLEEVQTRISSGEILAYSYFGAYHSWAKSPNSSRAYHEIGSITYEYGCDGEKAWDKHGWPKHYGLEPAYNCREAGGMALGRMVRNALFDPLLDYFRENPHMELRGTEMIEVTNEPQEMSKKGANTVKREALVLEVRPESNLREWYYVDKENYLPIRLVRESPYEEGIVKIAVDYGDYRKVGNVLLPFFIKDSSLDFPHTVWIKEYKLNEPLDNALFENPMAGNLDEPYDLSISLVPKRVYKEHDHFLGISYSRNWGSPIVQRESWDFNVAIREKYGRWLEPVSATAELFAGADKVKSVEYSKAHLKAREKFPMGRFGGVNEICDFNHHFCEPVALPVDRMIYSIRMKSPAGEILESRIEFPVTYYDPKNKFICPVKGAFIVTEGHSYVETEHKYERSQWFAYDFQVVDPESPFWKNYLGNKNEDWVTYGTEIYAAADGLVVDVLSDFKDEESLFDYQKRRTISEPPPFFGGNSIVIDHGQGEFSFSCHLKEGSIRVKKGERVKQGQVIARLGATPGGGYWFPHLHFQVQDGPFPLYNDGLPCRFENIALLSPLLSETGAVSVPKFGHLYLAK